MKVIKDRVVLLFFFISALFGGEWQEVRAPLGGGWGPEIWYWRCPDVFFLPGTRIGWVCGLENPAWSMSGVSRTTDGGNTWQAQATPYNPGFLLRGFFLNENLGWVVGGFSLVGGYNPILMRTTNGGNIWEGQSLPLGHNLWAVYFIDSLDGFAGGIAGLFLRTIDGGITWEPVLAPANFFITNLYFKDRLNGFASGFDGNQPYDTRGRVWKTTDAGNTWSELNIPSCTDIYAIFFLDSLKGWFVPRKYSTYCYYTNDGGITWSQSDSPVGLQPNAVSFSDSLKGWIAGGYSELEGDRSCIWRTTDGGITWVEQYSPTFHGLWGLATPSDTEAFAVGCYGTILHTTNGIDWECQNAGDQIWNISSADTLNLWACGDHGLVVKSTDGGASWKVLPNAVDYASGIPYEFRCISFPTADIGWVGGMAQILKHTTDGGLTWINQTTPFAGMYSKMQFTDTLNGWVICGQVLLQTTNGGNSWVVHNFNYEYRFYQIDFVDNEYGWAVGYKETSYYSIPVILHTTDAGQTWNRQPLPDNPSGGLASCDFVSLANGWVGGGNLLYTTTDGGQNWIQRNPGLNILSIGLADSLNGWVCTIREIYHSLDGGLSFNLEYGWPWPVSSNAQGITVVDSNHAWVCWNVGYVLKYVPPTGIIEQENIATIRSNNILKISPNPCDKSTNVNYLLTNKDYIALQLFDASGRLTKTIFKGIQKPGKYIIQLDIKKLPPGVYFVRFESGTYSTSQKVVIIR